MLMERIAATQVKTDMIILSGVFRKKTMSNNYYSSCRILFEL